MDTFKKEHWTEDDVRALLATQDTFVEGIPGAQIGQPPFREHVARTLCCFANNGSGTLVLGADAQGLLDGIPDPITGQTSAREWFARELPDLLHPALTAMQVHQVEPANPSAIPNGRVVLVVEVDTGSEGGYQSVVDKSAWYRYPKGSRSARREPTTDAQEHSHKIGQAGGTVGVMTYTYPNEPEQTAKLGKRLCRMVGLGAKRPRVPRL